MRTTKLKKLDAVENAVACESNAPKNRAEWAAEICNITHKVTVEAVLQIGRALQAAKDALPHGEFLEMIESDLPFSASVAQRYMRIARDCRLANAATVQLLPTDYSTLYELSKLPDEVFHQSIAEGKIHPGTTRKAANALATRPSAEPKKAEKPKLPPVKVILIEIEDKITELSERVSPDTVDLDSRKLGRSLGEQLIAWSRNEQPPQSMH
jgi:hypothetical protein